VKKNTCNKKWFTIFSTHTDFHFYIRPSRVYRMAKSSSHMAVEPWCWSTLQPAPLKDSEQSRSWDAQKCTNYLLPTAVYRWNWIFFLHLFLSRANFAKRATSFFMGQLFSSHSRISVKALQETKHWSQQVNCRILSLSTIKLLREGDLPNSQQLQCDKKNYMQWYTILTTVNNMNRG